MIKLEDEPFKEYTPSQKAVKYNNKTAHGRYRTAISKDVTERHVEPLFDELLI